MSQFRPRAAAVCAFMLAAYLLSPSSAPYARAQDAAPSAPPPGKALLYIFRSDRQPSDALVPVSVNTDTAGYLENGTFIAAIVNPGKTFVRSGDRVLATYSFEAAADRSYYVWVRAVHGQSVVQTEIDIVDDAQGRSALAQSRFMLLAQPAAPAASAAAAPAASAQDPAATSGAQPESAETGGKTYVRVEIGLSKSTGADIMDNDFANSGSICGDPNCNTAGKLKDVGTGAVAGFGVGTQFASHLRGELMLGLRFYQMNTTDASVPTTTFKATVTSLSAMANGYLDFAKSGVSPYLGLGIGVAVNVMGEVTAEQAGASASTDGGNSTGLAAAAMAGVGIPLSGGTVLDIGYRYIALGKVKIATNAAGYDGATGKLNAHELTVAFRF